MDQDLSKYPGLMDFCQKLYEDRYRSPYLMGCMVDTYEEMLEQDCDEKQEILDKATTVCSLYFMNVSYCMSSLIGER